MHILKGIYEVVLTDLTISLVYPQMTRLIQIYCWQFTYIWEFDVHFRLILVLWNGINTWKMKCIFWKVFMKWFWLIWLLVHPQITKLIQTVDNFQKFGDFMIDLVLSNGINPSVHRCSLYWFGSQKMSWLSNVAIWGIICDHKVG